MSDTPLGNFDSHEPPAGLNAPLQALWWLKKGDLSVGPEWEKAHEICQSAEGTKAYDWVHALAHLIEGDVGNAGYWFQRAGEAQTGDAIEREWAYIVERLNA
ncbi:MAG: hypothetical protein ABJN26_08215 [Stappiaceae bacterium]